MQRPGDEILASASWPDDQSGAARRIRANKSHISGLRPIMPSKREVPSNSWSSCNARWRCRASAPATRVTLPGLDQQAASGGKNSLNFHAECLIFVYTRRSVSLTKTEYEQEYANALEHLTQRDIRSEILIAHTVC